MVFHNTPENMSPFFQPESDRIVGAPVDARVIDDSGMSHRFSIERSQSVQQEIRAFINDFSITQQMPLNLYQSWIESHWKEPHGTARAAERFSEKLNEEVNELSEAMVNVMQNPEEATKRAASSELGDVLWCATALAVNSGGQLDTAIKMRAYQYSVGIRIHPRGDSEVPPAWQPAASTLATKYTLASIGDVQTVIDAGFPGFSSPVMTLFDEAEAVATPDWQELWSDLLLRTLSLGHHCIQPYDPPNPEQHETYGVFLRRGREIINPLIADLFLLSAVISSKILDASLAHVIAQNVRKIDSRVQTNHIDKSDGERSAEEY